MRLPAGLKISMADPGSAFLRIEIACAVPGDVLLFPVEVPAGATVAEAIAEAGIREKNPAIDYENNKIGIFGKLCNMNTILKDGDRIEIYRPLLADPKEARRHRASLQNKR